MDEGALLLTLEEAATHTGYRKRELRALVREGRLPAVRAGKRWQVSTSDLALLPLRIAAPAEPAPAPEGEAPAGKSADPVIALIELLRERDQKLAELLEERSQLTGQVGFLLGQLTEREERIQWLERTTLAISALPSVSALSHDPTPIALIDEWAKPPFADNSLGQNQPTLFEAPTPTQLRSAVDVSAVPPCPPSTAEEAGPRTKPSELLLGVAGSTADTRERSASILEESSEATNRPTEATGMVLITEPAAIMAAVPQSPESILIPSEIRIQPKRGLFGLFRRRA